MLTARVWGVSIAVGLLAPLAACTPPAVNPDGSVPQDRPLASNGLVADGTEVWVADLVGRQWLRFAPDTGRITRRVGAAEGLASPDDGVLMSDGSLVYTSPFERLVGRVRPDGSTSVVAHLPFGPNPIVRDPADPDGAVIVGDGASERGQLVRVFLDGRVPEVIASGLPTLNAFTVGPDGRIWAPSGGVSSALGSTGGVLRIDPVTGATEPLALSFPGEPGRAGFAFPCAAKFGPDGDLYVVQGVDAAVFVVDPATGSTRRLVDVPGGVADNLAFGVDGRLYVSQFLGEVSEVHPGPPAYPTTIPLGSPTA